MQTQTESHTRPDTKGLAGIVQGQAHVKAVNRRPEFSQLTVSFPNGSLKGIQHGASVAINGTCLTVSRRCLHAWHLSHAHFHDMLGRQQNVEALCQTCAAVSHRQSPFELHLAPRTTSFTSLLQAVHDGMVRASSHHASRRRFCGVKESSEGAQGFSCLQTCLNGVLCGLSGIGTDAWHVHR